jgi:hypothetical protein
MLLVRLPLYAHVLTHYLFGNAEKISTGALACGPGVDYGRGGTTAAMNDTLFNS